MYVYFDLTINNTAESNLASLYDVCKNTHEDTHRLSIHGQTYLQPEARRNGWTDKHSFRDSDAPFLQFDICLKLVVL